RRRLIIASSPKKNLAVASIKFPFTAEKSRFQSKPSNKQIIFPQFFPYLCKFDLLCPFSFQEVAMATEQPKPAAKDVKMDLFEDDDEFEEFAIDQEWEDKEKGKEVTQQWEDDWDDDDVNDDFSLQLRKELEINTEKK
ncbi:hypothetical protein AABB24_026854, partial [Solanum stoloniferum]